MSAEVDIYDFEGVIESAIAQVFEDNNLVCATTETEQEFQKNRPRVEAMFLCGSGKGRLRARTMNPGDRVAPGFLRETSWGGQLKLELITEAEIKIHKEYRSRIRNLLATIAPQINEVLMPRHCLQSLHDSGTSPIINPQEGIYQSTMLFDVDFSIQADAFEELET